MLLTVCGTTTCTTAGEEARDDESRGGIDRARARTLLPRCCCCCCCRAEAASCRALVLPLLWRPSALIGCSATQLDDAPRVRIWSLIWHGRQSGAGTRCGARWRRHAAPAARKKSRSPSAAAHSLTHPLSRQHTQPCRRRRPTAATTSASTRRTASCTRSRRCGGKSGRGQSRAARRGVCAAAFCGRRRRRRRRRDLLRVAQC